MVARLVTRETPNLSELREFRGYLTIDRDSLPDCLIEQPEIYYMVAAHYTVAVSERDQIKLELEEARAELDVQFRKEAAKAEEKITEGALQNKLRVAPKIKELERQLLKAKLLADDWSALKEGFSQRSFMLRELVGLHISQRHDENASGGRLSGHARLAAANKAETDVLRRSRPRLGGSDG